MNSNLSFDSDSNHTINPIDDNIFDGLNPKESLKRPASSSVCSDTMQYFAESIQLMIDEIDTGLDSAIIPSTSGSPFSSRQSSIQSIDSSVVDDDVEVTQHRSREIEERSLSPNFQFLCPSYEQNNCVPKRQRRISDAETNSEANVDYLKLLADARRVIDSMTSTIQVMSTRMTKLQRRHVSDLRDQDAEGCLTPDVMDESVLSPTNSMHSVEESPLEWNPVSNDLSNVSFVENQDWSESDAPSYAAPGGEIDDLVSSEGVSMSALELRISSPIEPLWYAERPYPPFTVDVVDSTSQRKVLVNGWKVMVDMIDGFNNSATDKLSGTGQYPGHQFPVVNGTATISGIRFRAVSSKCGGYFRIIVSVSSPSCELPPKSVPTPNIQVLSYRLYHAPKVPFESLRPDDSVSKIKGIGSLYAKRLQSLGIERVSQLASIDVNTIGEPGIKLLLGTIRKDRGAMTMARLTDYIQQARVIVARAPPTYSPQVPHTHTVARPTTWSEKRQVLNQHLVSQPVTLWSAINSDNLQPASFTHSPARQAL